MTNKEFENLIALSALEIPHEKHGKLGDDISSILSYVEKLQGIDFGDISDPREILIAKDLRDDIVVDNLHNERDILLSNFPSKTSDDLLEAEAVLPRDI
jgi:aspartyl/glutamyl-tRNA(Asn/Gln) amidotransferase C subunit